MSQTLTPEQQQMVEQVYPHAEELRYKGLAATEILKELESQGLDRSTAQAVLNRLYKKSDKAGREAAMESMLIGVAICIVGIAVTAFTYAMASNGGGITIISYGAILGGGVKFLWGLIDYIKS